MVDLDRLKAENDALRDMFQTPGWAVLVRNTQERMDEFRKASPFNIPDEKTLYFSQGLFAALDTIIRMPEYLEATEAAMAAMPEEDE